MNSALDLEAIESCINWCEEIFGLGPKSLPADTILAAKSTLECLRQPRPPESGTGTPPREFRTGMSFDEWWDARAFEFGYDSIKAAHTAAREAWMACIALAPEEPPREVPEGKDQGLTASDPSSLSLPSSVLTCAKHYDRACTTCWACAMPKSPPFQGGQEVPAPLPGEPATAPRPDLEAIENGCYEPGESATVESMAITALIAYIRKLESGPGAGIDKGEG